MRALRLAAVLAAVTAGFALLGTHEAAAQTPSTTPAAATSTPARPVSEEQALQIERQLLCPICTNERLDVCSNAICNDMKRVIRERLAAGSTPDDIILYFETRFGPKVRAKLPREGFNLVLFGWVGGALLLSGLAAAYALYSLRRDSRRRVAPAPARPHEDDRWVDALLDEADDRDTPRGAR